MAASFIRSDSGGINVFIIERDDDDDSMSLGLHTFCFLNVMQNKKKMILSPFLDTACGTKKQKMCCHLLVCEPWFTLVAPTPFLYLSDLINITLSEKIQQAYFSSIY